MDQTKEAITTSLPQALLLDSLDAAKLLGQELDLLRLKNHHDPAQLEESIFSYFFFLSV